MKRIVSYFRRTNQLFKPVGFGETGLLTKKKDQLFSLKGVEDILPLGVEMFVRIIDEYL